MNESKHVYLYSGEAYMAAKSFAELRRTLDIQHEQLNVTVYKETPDADALIAECASVPFMSPQRLVAVRSGSLFSGKGGTTDGKRMADFLPGMPSSTVLVFLSPQKPDKRRVLYKQIQKLGQVKEHAEPKPGDCARFAAEQAKAQGTKISKRAADTLVEIAGCDYYTVENEIAKLAIYTDGTEITQADVIACASRSLEFNVFEIHSLLVRKKVSEAYALLNDILADQRPEALIGIFARKIGDLYKVKAMSNAGYNVQRMAETLGIRSTYVAGKLKEECARFSLVSLRQSLKRLASLDHAIKSGREDASLALPDALVRIYEL